MPRRGPRVRIPSRALENCPENLANPRLSGLFVLPKMSPRESVKIGTASLCEMFFEFHGKLSLTRGFGNAIFEMRCMGDEPCKTKTAFDRRRQKGENMRKSIFIWIVIFIVGGAIGAMVSERFRISADGISAYDVDKYTVSDTETEKITMSVELGAKIIDPITVWESDKLSLVVNSIESITEGYRLSVTSKGYAEFEEGAIVVFDKFRTPLVRTTVGDFQFVLVKSEELKESEQEHIFKLVPLGNGSITNVGKQTVSIDLSGTMLRTYKRK